MAFISILHISLKSRGSILILSSSLWGYHLSDVISKISSHRAWGYVGKRCGGELRGLFAGICRYPDSRCAAELLAEHVQAVAAAVDKVCDYIGSGCGGGCRGLRDI